MAEKENRQQRRNLIANRNKQSARKVLKGERQKGAEREDEGTVKWRNWKESLEEEGNWVEWRKMEASERL